MSEDCTSKSLTGAIAARLRQVVFSYDSRVDLSTTDRTGAPSMSVEPDERGNAVLQGVDLTIPEGSFTVVMGASGGGKSTLLRTFNAIIPDFINGAFDGDVTVLGRDATASRVSEMAEVVGTVFQDYETQLFRTSIDAEVAFGPENLAVPPAEIGDRIERALSFVGLDDVDRTVEPSGLSGGQKQRLVLASVLAMHPSFLVLDEPTSDLDPQGTRDLVAVMSDLTSGEKRNEPSEEQMVDNDATTKWAPDTTVMVTHKIEEALLADRVALLRGGRVYREGPIHEVFTDREALREARVAVPPLVETFARLEWPNDDLPLLPAEALDRIDASSLDWMPPKTSEVETPANTGTAPGEVVFDLEKVVFEYETDRGPTRAVDGVDLTIREGEAIGIVGQNGSGKTTLAKHFNGLNEPDSGSVEWRGQAVSDLSMTEIGQHVGYVFQNPDHQLFASTVREEVAFGPENFGLTGEALDDRVQNAIETVELDAVADADPFTLSKGQRQRVALAGVLATDPEVIVFDEPTTGLDVAQQQRFLDLIARLNREDDLTVVMVTHDMGTIAQYASRTVVLQNGRKEYDGSSRDLFADPTRLDAYGLQAPHVVQVSNELNRGISTDELPALSVDELVAGLGGPGADEAEGEHVESTSECENA